jgi:hypothetical protein
MNKLIAFSILTVAAPLALIALVIGYKAAEALFL